MAITEDPLKVSEMVTSEQSNFNSMSDDALKSITSAVNSAVSSATSSYSIPSVSAYNSTYSQTSIFENILCTDLPSLLLRQTGYWNELWRGFGNWDALNICSKSKNASPVDTILALSNFIARNPGVLSSDSSTRINSLLRSNILQQMNILGLGSTIPTCIFGQSSGWLYGNSYLSGMSLGSRNNLRDLLRQNDCTASLLRNPLISSFVSYSAGAAVINVLLDADNSSSSLYKYVDAALAVTGQRTTVLGSLASSLTYAYCWNQTYNKVKTVSYVNQNGNLTASEKAYLKSDVTGVLENLDKETEENDLNTDDPTEMFDTIIEGLDVIEPTWRNDDNYHKTIDNNTLKELSEKKLLSKYSREINLTGEYETVLTPEICIRAINSFEHSTDIINY